MMYKITCDDYVIFETDNPELIAFKGVLTRELNFSGSLVFSIAKSHPYYEYINAGKVIRCYVDGVLKFTGELTTAKLDNYATKTFTCLGVLSKLSQTVQGYFAPTNYTVRGFVEKLINQHNTQTDSKWRMNIGEVTVTDSNDNIYRGLNYEETSKAISEKLIDSLGGYIRCREETDGLYFDYLSGYDEQINLQNLTFGENIVKIIIDQKQEDVYTAVLPLGAKLNDETEERLTISSVNGGSDIIINQEAVDIYGIRVLKVIYDDVTVASNLLTKGYEALEYSRYLITTYSVNAIDLAKFGYEFTAFELGQYTTIKSPLHGVDTTSQITKIVDNIDNPAKSLIVCGGSIRTLTENKVKADKVIDKINSDYVVNEQIISVNKKIDDEVNILQNQIDGTIQFWEGQPIPTLDNYPANEWTTDVEREKHHADIYTRVDGVIQGQAYRFSKVSNQWVWLEITDTELATIRQQVELAQQMASTAQNTAEQGVEDAENAQNTADRKSTTFTSIPDWYNKGDTWLLTSDFEEWTAGTLLTAIRENYKFEVADWQEEVKYTDDTTADRAEDKADGALNVANSKNNTWYNDEIPTLDNFPANTWTTDSSKRLHVNDTYTDTTGLDTDVQGALVQFSDHIKGTMATVEVKANENLLENTSNVLQEYDTGQFAESIDRIFPNEWEKMQNKKLTMSGSVSNNSEKNVLITIIAIPSYRSVMSPITISGNSPLQEFKHTFVLSDIPVNTTYLDVRLQNSNDQLPSVVGQWQNFKLEVGEVKTPWLPNVNDGVAFPTYNLIQHGIKYNDPTKMQVGLPTLPGNSLFYSTLPVVVEAGTELFLSCDGFGNDGKVVAQVNSPPFDYSWRPSTWVVPETTEYVFGTRRPDSVALTDDDKLEIAEKLIVVRDYTAVTLNPNQPVNIPLIDGINTFYTSESVPLDITYQNENGGKVYQFSEVDGVFSWELVSKDNSDVVLPKIATNSSYIEQLSDQIKLAVEQIIEQGEEIDINKASIVILPTEIINSIREGNLASDVIFDANGMKIYNGDLAIYDKLKDDPEKKLVFGYDVDTQALRIVGHLNTQMNNTAFGDITLYTTDLYIEGAQHSEVGVGLMFQNNTYTGQYGDLVSYGGLMFVSETISSAEPSKLVLVNHNGGVSIVSKNETYYNEERDEEFGTGKLLLSGGDVSLWSETFNISTYKNPDDDYVPTINNNPILTADSNGVVKATGSKSAQVAGYYSFSQVATLTKGTHLVILTLTATQSVDGIVALIFNGVTTRGNLESGGGLQLTTLYTTNGGSISPQIYHYAPISDVMSYQIKVEAIKILGN